MQRVYGNNVHLSEIAQIYQPQTISSIELTEDGFLVYGANGIIGKYKDYNHETEQIWAQLQISVAYFCSIGLYFLV